MLTTMLKTSVICLYPIEIIHLENGMGPTV